MKDKLPGKRKITNKKAIEILARNGVQITEKSAEDILDLMYFLAKLIINQNFKK